MNILLVAIDPKRWGPARLPQWLGKAGFRVFALCPEDNSLAKTRYVEKVFALQSVVSSRYIERRLTQVMAELTPDFVVACDERILVCLHSIIRTSTRNKSRLLSNQMIRTLLLSLGEPDSFDDAVFKDRTMAVARSIGVNVPEGGPAYGTNSALAIASRIGFPLMVKQRFGWAGRGVFRCCNRDDLEAAMSLALGKHKFASIPIWLKRLLRRDWHPTSTTCEIQTAIDGVPAMFCGVAFKGKLLAGYTAIKTKTQYEHGPSSVVSISNNAAVQSEARLVVEALRLSGFFGLDFMIEHLTERPYFIECNPRPIPISHLGRRVGIDLCAALFCALKGWSLNAENQKCSDAVIALFPQEWIRDPLSIDFSTLEWDLPEDDPGLLEYILDEADNTGERQSYKINPTYWIRISLELFGRFLRLKRATSTV